MKVGRGRLPTGHPPFRAGRRSDLEGDVNTMREIAKAIIRSMGIDKYVKCE
jgi:hypothetical protein